MRTYMLASILLALFSSASAAPASATRSLNARAGSGSTVIKNTCNFPVYKWTVAGSVGPMDTIAPGQQISELYTAGPGGAGVSIKLARTNDLDTAANDIMQFEYTLGGNQVFYDLSMVNGDPFKGLGPVIHPSVATCPISSESDAYYKFDDDWATKACVVNADLVLSLCG